MIHHNTDDSLIGICGGVGPGAGILLHQLILNNTENNGKDQGHLNICHMSRSNDAPDRTEYLLGNIKTNPAIGMARTFESIKSASNSKNTKRTVVGVPCNTFHSPIIWNEFIKLIHTNNTNNDNNIKCLNMLEETLNFIKLNFGLNCKKIGLLSTTGTRNSKVYNQLFESQGFEILQVDDHLQFHVHDTIYNNEFGIKSTAPIISKKAMDNFHYFAKLLSDEGAQVIILGCTEIPFAFQGVDKIGNAVLLDPMVALARALIREVAPEKLKPSPLDKIPIAEPTKVLGIPPDLLNSKIPAN